MDFRPCILIPTYENPQTIRAVVERVRAILPEVVVIDDASGPAGRAAVEKIGADGLAHVTHRATNGGKGAAVKTGFTFARSLGYTHAVQVDADGQHALEDIPRFLDLARAQPTALVLGQPRFDASAPIGRRIGRQISIFWTHLEAGWNVVGDPLCGFRVYPLAAAIRAGAAGDRMDFDPEIAVRIAWTGAPVVRLETSVRYLDASEGGVSHFKVWRDNWLIARMHARLMTAKVSAFFLRRPLIAPEPPS